MILKDKFRTKGIFSLTKKDLLFSKSEYMAVRKGHLDLSERNVKKALSFSVFRSMKSFFPKLSRYT